MKHQIEWSRNTPAIFLVIFACVGLGYFLASIDVAEHPFDPQANYENCAKGDFAHCDTTPRELAPNADENKLADSNAPALRQELREEKSLRTQQQIAFWTGAMFPASLLTIGLLFFTWRAARDGVRETRRIGEAQTRAYLHVSKINVWSRGTVLYCEVSTTNTGQSPAADIRFTYCWELFVTPKNSAQAPEHILKKTEPGVSRPIAAQTSEISGFLTDPMTGELLSAFQSPKGICFEVYGEISWRDVFHMRQTQDFEFSFIETHRTNFFTVDANGISHWHPVEMLPGRIDRENPIIQ